MIAKEMLRKHGWVKTGEDINHAHGAWHNEVHLAIGYSEASLGKEPA